MAARLLFVMDPPHTVLPDADTSFALIEAALGAVYSVDHCLIQDLGLQGKKPGARARQVITDRQRAPYLHLSSAHAWVPLEKYAAVFVRKDPPFDSNYLYATQILELARGTTLVVNDPRGLRDANEKLYATHFLDVMPPTCVTAHKDDIFAFQKAQGGNVVIKPLSGAGGDSVFLLRQEDLNRNAIVETVTQNGSRMVMVQKFLPQVSRGDKRILLLAGKPLGAIWRIPKKDDVRSNIHVGGSVALADLDRHDERIIATLAPKLKADGLYFVGLDVIGGKLTEVNVTSPTGIQQMSRFMNKNLSKKVIDWVQKQTR